MSTIPKAEIITPSEILKKYIKSREDWMELRGRVRRPSDAKISTDRLFIFGNFRALEPELPKRRSK